MRDLPFAWIGIDGIGLAPAWVVVSDRRSGQLLRKVSAGRAHGSGEHLLARIREDAAVMSRAEFLATWTS